MLTHSFVHYLFTPPLAHSIHLLTISLTYSLVYELILLFHLQALLRAGNVVDVAIDSGSQVTHERLGKGGMDHTN